MPQLNKLMDDVAFLRSKFKKLMPKEQATAKPEDTIINFYPYPGMSFVGMQGLGTATTLTASSSWYGTTTVTPGTGSYTISSFSA